MALHDAVRGQAEDLGVRVLATGGWDAPLRPPHEYAVYADLELAADPIGVWRRRLGPGGVFRAERRRRGAGGAGGSRGGGRDGGSGRGRGGGSDGGGGRGGGSGRGRGGGSDGGGSSGSSTTGLTTWVIE
ncbi:hypothetical protein BDZ88DRAFT_454840 [Geranomyces variabilis]|nr:hypothetical protein BDZ88DRAFT_454840 [Geranomyces variabilis]KAJ3136392.1 hypothetical protein HDU90_003099 [Geranomyces variabilis]